MAFKKTKKTFSNAEDFIDILSEIYDWDESSTDGERYVRKGNVTIKATSSNSLSLQNGKLSSVAMSGINAGSFSAYESKEAIAILINDNSAISISSCKNIYGKKDEASEYLLVAYTGTSFNMLGGSANKSSSISNIFNQDATSMGIQIIPYFHQPGDLIADNIYQVYKAPTNTINGETEINGKNYVVAKYFAIEDR